MVLLGAICDQKQKLFTIGVGQIGSNSLLKLLLSQAEETERVHVTPGS